MSGGVRWSETAGRLERRVNGEWVRVGAGGGGGGGGGGASAAAVEIDLGATAVFQGSFTITDGTITGTSKVLAWQAPGPYTGKGARADEAELQPVEVISVEPAAGSARVRWQTPPLIAVRRVVPEGTRDPSTAQLPTFEQVRLGRARGKVRFAYVVLS